MKHENQRKSTKLLTFIRIRSSVYASNLGEVIRGFWGVTRESLLSGVKGAE